MHGHGVKQDPHGNLFEGEWREGKPVLKNKSKGNEFMSWLNETVGAVSNQPRRNNDYASVSQDED